MTLDQFFPGLIRADGRKFTLIINCQGFYFEPIFKDHAGFWHGFNNIGQHDIWNGSTDSWIEWQEPKKTKKITLYKPILPGYEDTYWSKDEWHTDKNNWSLENYKIVGWMQMDCEVQE